MFNGIMQKDVGRLTGRRCCSKSER